MAIKSANSYIFSFKPDVLSRKTYCLVLAVTAFAVILSIVGFALYLVPMDGMHVVGSGDLTRIGWLSNNRYGNRKANQVFRPSLVTRGEVVDRHFDVVVVGDSFSLDLDKSWPNYLAAKGLSVLVIGIDDDGTKQDNKVPLVIESQIKTIFESQGFRENPPAVFIFETIERLAKRRLVKEASSCVEFQEINKHKADSNALVEPPTIQYANFPKYEIEEVKMPSAGRLDKQQLTYARDFLHKNIRQILARDSLVKEYPLNSPRFSSERSTSLLVFIDDLRKKNWTSKDIEEMQCQLLSFQQTIQSNGKTLFVALPIPDKLSAYHDNLVDPTLPRGIIDQLNDPKLNRPQVEKVIQAEITAGNLDVYLPNDTHFGWRGQALTAETVLRYIEQRTRKVEAAQTRNSDT